MLKAMRMNSDGTEKVGAEGFTAQLSDPIEFKKGKYVTLNFSLVPAFVLPSSTPVTVPNNNS